MCKFIFQCRTRKTKSTKLLRKMRTGIGKLFELKDILHRLDIIYSIFFKNSIFVDIQGSKFQVSLI